MGFVAGLDVGEVAEELGIRWAEVVPCSAETGENVDVVGDVLLGLLPPGPMYYPDGEITDEPTETLIAELIREAALEGVRDELPHSIAVTIDEILPRPDRPEDKPLTDVFASIVVERESQKGIVIGKGGSVLKEVGTRVREQMPEGAFVELFVKVQKDWQRNATQLDRLGY